MSVRFDQGIQWIIPLSIEYLYPHAWDRLMGMYTAGEEGNATAYVTHLFFSDSLVESTNVGTVVGGFSTDGKTRLLESGLVGCPEIWNSSGITLGDVYILMHNYRNKSFAKALEELSRSVTYSMMTFYSGRQDTKTLAVNATSPRNLFSYDRVNLCITYVASLLVILASVGVGGAALWSNGVTSSTVFSTVLLTPRNPDLDRLAEGRSLGSDPLPKDIGKTRLRFGCLDLGESMARAGFGVEGTVTLIRRGERLH